VTDTARQMSALRRRASDEYKRLYAVATLPAVSSPFRSPDGSLVKYQMRQINPPTARSNDDYMHGNVDYYAEMAKAFGVIWPSDRCGRHSL